MILEIVTQNLLNPAILCFFLGFVARIAGSDLEFPKPLPKLFSLYLLFAIGYKGGLGIARTGLTADVMLSLGLCVALSVVVPLYAFYLLRLKFDAHNAAAVAATYGSISAVTFITATVFLDDAGVPYGSYMVAAMALMESPAIVVGVMFSRFYGLRDKENAAPMKWKEIMRDAFLNGSVVILVGAMLIGWASGERGYAMVKPFTHEIFYGMLCLFLLDMGIVSARRIGGVFQVGLPVLGFAIGLPILNAALGLGLVMLFGLPLGSGFLLVVLAASASYIAVPAAMRLAVPQSNAGIYLPMSLAVTFPFNIIVGIPTYFYILKALGVQ